MKRFSGCIVASGLLVLLGGCGGGSSGPTIPITRSNAVVFVSTRDGNSQIYAMSFDGSNQTRLTNSAGNDTEPRLSRDGQFVVFSSDRDGNAEIYHMNADGSNVVRLTNDQTASQPADTAPALSPDDATIAWASTRGGTPAIWLMDASGTNQRALGVAGFDPSFSPDGRSLVYSSTRDTGAVLIARTLATGAERVLDTMMVGQLRHPRFSADGKTVVYYTFGRGGASLLSVRTDGTQLTRFSPLIGPLNVATAGFNASGDSLVFQDIADTSSGGEQILSAPVAHFATRRQLTTQGRNYSPATAG